MTEEEYKKINERWFEASGLMQEINHIEETISNIERGRWRIDILSKPVSQGIKDALDELDCTQEEALEVFKQCLNKAELDDTWMHFSFF